MSVSPVQFRKDIFSLPALPALPPGLGWIFDLRRCECAICSRTWGQFSSVRSLPTHPSEQSASGAIRKTSHPHLPTLADSLRASIARVYSRVPTSSRPSASAPSPFGMPLTLINHSRRKNTQGLLGKRDGDKEKFGNKRELPGHGIRVWQHVAACRGTIIPSAFCPSLAQYRGLTGPLLRSTVMIVSDARP